MDFAEKYKVKAISLTPEAAVALTKYRFPGNIRQLKNLVEQMSVLQITRDISIDILLKYLPSESTYLPALYKMHNDVGDQSKGFSERELLYKVLFDMRKDMTELKKLVHGLISEGALDHSVLESHADLFHGPRTEPKQPVKPVSESYSTDTYVLDSDESISAYDPDRIEDITHETQQDESLSLEVREKELIIKALRKNNNKRKYAAQDLGISERTLYRKIKQYEIED